MSSQTASKRSIRPSRALQQRPSGLRIFILVFLLLHLPLFVYPVLRLSSWLELGTLLTWMILVPVATSQIVSRWLLRNSPNPAVRRLRQVLDMVLGISPVVLALLLVAEVLVLAAVFEPRAAAWLVISASTLVMLGGIAAASRPSVHRVSFAAERLQAPLRFVQITDVHIGSRSAHFLSGVVARIKRLEPEFVCITGDFIDAWGVPESDLVSLKSLDCPIYFCTGNHERYEDFDAILERLGNLGVNVLRSQALMARDDVQVIGIDDRDDALQVARELPKIALDPEAFQLLLYHRPHGLDAAEAAGIDLMIAGHTHNGQIIPFNLLVKRVFSQICGLYEKGRARLYVSPGTGTWGPVMRVGTRSEITLFELEVD